MRAFEVRRPADLRAAFAAMADWLADGLVTLTDGMLFSQRDRVVELALKSKLPAVYPAGTRRPSTKGAAVPAHPGHRDHVLA